MRATLRIASIVLCALLARPALAVDPESKAAIGGVITRQLDAFQHDDAAAAFSFASPAIQTMFGDAATFMSMVQRAYPPVYRPRSSVLTALVDTDQGPEQSVSLVDGDGDAWTAIYTMEQQPDGRWLIKGCRLVRNGVGA